jgi:hypothetical protein
MATATLHRPVTLFPISDTISKNRTAVNQSAWLYVTDIMQLRHKADIENIKPIIIKPLLLA